MVSLADAGVAFLADLAEGVGVAPTAIAGVASLADARVASLADAGVTSVAVAGVASWSTLLRWCPRLTLLEVLSSV